MKFCIKDFFSKCDQIRCFLSFLRIWSHLLKKSLMENFIFLCNEWWIAEFIAEPWGLWWNFCENIWRLLDTITLFAKIARYLHVMEKFCISLIWNMFANLYSYLLIFLTSFFLIDSHCWWIWTTLQTSLSDEEGCRFLRVTAFPIQWEDQVRLFAKQIVEVGKMSSKRLAHLKPMFHPYRIQPIDFQCKYIDWFLYKWSIGLIWVKSTFLC